MLSKLPNLTFNAEKKGDRRSSGEDGEAHGGGTDIKDVFTDPEVNRITEMAD